MFSKIDAVQLFDLLTKGHEREKNRVLITSAVVNQNMGLQEAINQRLDIIFDEIVVSNVYLGKNRDLLEKCLRQVGASWKQSLEGE